VRKPSRFDLQLAALRGSPSADDVRAALRSKNGILIAAAVPHATAPELESAFGTLLDDATKRDPICRGKVAIARALHERDEWSEIFVAGATHTQMEGGVDTAAELRGICGLAHAHFSRPDALDVLADLLADSAVPTRIAAAQALGDTGRADASALLRYKLRTGDVHGEVMGAAAGALLHLQRERTLPFLLTLLVPPHDDAIALALAESRLPDALPPLRAWVERTLPETRRAIGYLALALTRAANDDLLAVVREGDRADALAAAKALATFRDDPAVREALVAAAPRALRKEIEALLD
jgi:HEAT repeat protein